MINVGIIGASGSPVPSCCGSACAPPGAAGGVRHRGLAGRHRGGRAVPEPGGRLPGPGVRAVVDPSCSSDVDVVFLGLPHGASQDDRAGAAGPGPGRRRPRARTSGCPTSADYEQWYGAAHTRPELLDRFVYGLPELHRDRLRGADCIATPGCYPTAASLPMAPLVRAGLVDHRADHRGRGLRGVGCRPTAQAEHHVLRRRLGRHRVRAARPPPHPRDGDEHRCLGALHPAPGADEPRHPGHLLRAGRRATDCAPTTCSTASPTFYARRAVRGGLASGRRRPRPRSGSNTAHLTARVDERTGTVIGLCAIDNLGKGASGAAVQCANLALGLDETAGLSAGGDLPMTRSRQPAPETLHRPVGRGRRAAAGAALHRAVPRRGRGGEVRRQRDVAPRAVRRLRQGHRHDAPGGHASGRGARRRPADRRVAARAWARRSEFVDGRRVTDAETLEVAQMVLIGKVNSDIVTALNTFGPVALGLAGTDAMLLEAEAHDPDLGFVGSVTKVNPELITRTLSMDLIPVIATIGADDDRPDLQHQRGRRRDRDRTGARSREAHLPDRRARTARRRRRPRLADHPGRHRRGAGADRLRGHLGRDDPQDGRLHPGDRARRRVGAPDRRSAVPRAAARAADPRGCGHDGRRPGSAGAPS